MAQTVGSKKREIFLKSLRERPHVTNAAKVAGVDKAILYRYRKTHPEFAAAWEEAFNEGIDRLEEVAVERAEKGLSDTLLIFMLKGAKPHRYRDFYKAEVNMEIGIVEVCKRLAQADRTEGKARVIGGRGKVTMSLPEPGDPDNGG